MVARHQNKIVAPPGQPVRKDRAESLRKFNLSRLSHFRMSLLKGGVPPSRLTSRMREDKNNEVSLSCWICGF